MKKNLIQKIAYFTAVVVFSNILPAGNVTLAAAGGQMQMMNQKDSTGSSQDQPYYPAESDTASDPGQAENPAKPDPSGNPAQPDKAAALGQSDKAAGADQSDSDPITEIGQTGDSAQPDQTGSKEQTDQTDDPTKPDQTAGTDQTDDPVKSDQTADPDQTDDPTKPDQTAGTDQTADPDQTDESEKPQKPEKPKAPKLKKPVLEAASKPNGAIKLKWKKVKGAAEYVVLRSTEKDSGFHSIYKTKKGTVSYVDTGRAPGKVYYYRLAAFSEGRKSRADSRVVSGRSLEQVKLTGISNVSGSRNLVIQWESVAGADHYQIVRKNAATGKYEKAGSVKGNKVTFTDKNRVGGTVYTYCVYAADAFGGRGNYSEAQSQMAIDQNKKMIALTYDDGPSAFTPIVLDALAKHGGHATFFVVGNKVNRYAGSVRRAVSMGCEIGNHTYDHSNLKNLSTVQVQSVLNQTNQAVKNQSGFQIRLVRPPYGSYNSAVSAAAGMPIIMWSIDTLDWKTRSTSATIQCVQQKAYDGAVVLMHDLHQPTALAADAVVKYLKNAGYQLVTISELAAYRGGLKNGTAYSQFRI